MSRERGASEHFTENRPQRIQEQWRFREIFNGDEAVSVAGTYYDIMPTSSDVLVSFIKFRHVGGVNEAMTVRVTVDGQPAMDVLQVAVANTWYYIYLSDEEDDIIANVVQTKAGDLGTDWYGQSMRIEYMAANAAVVMEGRVRAWQL